MTDHIHYEAQQRAHEYLNAKRKAREDKWLAIAFGLGTAVLIFCVLWG